ncbi:malonyl-CoA/methylmalonyl-CoA synthetase [Geodermatophilus africanus]|uniref:Malonyl-CoA/methylmalonyl-CoA synthetase n=1 Tax=Geodermatophilus africanus TaxID=1137993 RepID=A0A1H3PKQ4_9ACTN|nr:class I adenylate-forming enzyme family protein [Geodermatophilus africanus]SDZ01734.1 malonyl-CoA/methylmalonyl-CoA synthetase [Geodermatophilus africanus]
MSELVQRLLGAAKQRPDAPAVVDPDGRVTTYADLFAAASHLGHALHARGIRRGDRVAMWTDDSRPAIEAYVGCALAGLVVVPLNARYTASEVHGILADTEPAVLVWTSSQDGSVEELRDDGALDGCTLVRIGPGASPAGTLAWAEVVSTGDVRPPAVELDGNALLAIGHTSGTTGVPKGAMITHASAAAVARQHERAYRLVPRSTVALTGSLSFVSVMPAHVLSHLVIGGRVLLLGRWDVDSLLDRVARDQATFTYLPSPVLSDFADAAERRPEALDSLRSILHSASKAHPDHLARLVAATGTRLVEGWGMTENSGGLMTATTVADLEDARDDPGVLATVGRPLPGYEVRAEDGELLVKGPGIVPGYWRRPDQNAQTFVHGWFRTGDAGHVDDRGRVVVLERRTDLIVSGGMNVYPAEVEQVIDALPDVVECAVVGAAHERWGQTVVAVVVRPPGSDLTEEDVVAACRRRLAGYKKPTRVVFVDQLPRTVGLKVSRAAVRSQVAPPVGHDT